jgi:hypothetical protein
VDAMTIFNQVLGAYVLAVMLVGLIAALLV